MTRIVKINQTNISQLKFQIQLLCNKNYNTVRQKIKEPTQNIVKGIPK